MFMVKDKGMRAALSGLLISLCVATFCGVGIVNMFGNNNNNVNPDYAIFGFTAAALFGFSGVRLAKTERW